MTPPPPPSSLPSPSPPSSSPSSSLSPSSSPLPLVLVHGYMGGSGQWDLQRDVLGAGRDLITIDLPGFGENSDLAPLGSISDCANYVLDYVSDLGIQRFDLLGHSMGGMIVQEMIFIAPWCANRLVLYGTSCSGDLPDRFETFERSAERIISDGVVTSARRISATWFLDLEDAVEYENCASIAERSSLAAMLSGLKAMQSWSRRENLCNISCPTLIIWGEKDRTYRWAQIEELWRDIPSSSLSVLPNCSHAAHLEKPDIFNLIVRDFLS